MNPFEHQFHATKFNPNKFTPEKATDNLPHKNTEPSQGEAPKQNSRLRPKEAEEFDLKKILEKQHSFGIKKERSPEEIEQEKIQRFFKSGNLQEITDFLANEKTESPSFDNEISRVKNDYEEHLSSADFLSHKDWMLLTAIELFDRKTFEHSVGTYLIARKKIEERLVELGQEITHEGVGVEQFYRGCLFHDIGKLAIPDFILNSATTDNEWAYYFMELPEDDQDKLLVENNIIVPDAIRNHLGKMTDFFAENRIRAVKFVPIKTILNKKQIETLEKQELDPENSLGEMVRIHEKKSEEILLKLGYPLEALLAGNHHNYKHQNKKLGEKPTSLSAVHISGEISSNLIHLADVQQALRENRTYHQKQPALRILAFLIDDAKNGIIDPAITARWIEDELQKMNPDYLSEIRNMKAKHQHHSYLQKRNKELLLIDDFLSDNLPEEKQVAA